MRSHSWIYTGATAKTSLTHFCSPTLANRESAKASSRLCRCIQWSGELLSDILDRRNVPDDDRRRIFDHWMSQRRRAERILETESIEDEISDVTKEEFESRPISLDLSGAFFEADISYSYEDYLRHSEETEEFAASHPNYHIEKNIVSCFSGICRYIFTKDSGRWFQKERHRDTFCDSAPKLRGAIESFIPPVVEH